MNRTQAIKTIESLYPTDSLYPETNAIGERLLAQAKKEFDDWRNLPDKVLIRYAELCLIEDFRRLRGEKK